MLSASVLFFCWSLVESVATVIVALHTWCSQDLYPIARELIALNWEERSFQGVARFLQAILCSSRICSDGAVDCKTSACSPLDDFDLISLVEVVVRHSCTELLGTVCELLSKRLLHSTLILTTPLSKNAPLTASELLTRSLLNPDPSLPTKASRSMVPFECFSAFPATNSHDRPPSQSLDMLAATLACLEPPKASNGVKAPPPLLIGEDCVLRLLDLSVDTATLPCARLVSLLSTASPRVAECFVTSHLHDVCLLAGGGRKGALVMVKGFLARAGRKDIKVVRKLILDKCVEILESDLKTWSQDEQVRST